MSEHEIQAVSLLADATRQGRIPWRGSPLVGFVADEAAWHYDLAPSGNLLVWELTRHPDHPTVVILAGCPGLDQLRTLAAGKAEEQHNVALSYLLDHLEA